jgi:uncharacterized protein (TIGR03790 family)
MTFCGNRAVVRILVLIALVLASAVRAATNGGEEVAVIYNRGVPESKQVAEYYAAKRGVPADHLIGLQLTSQQTASITRSEYNEKIALALIKELEEHNLATFKREAVPGGKPSKWGYSVSSFKVRYLALCYGVPYYITRNKELDAVKDEGLESTTPFEMRRNEAAVDSELALLPRHGHLPISGPVQNALYGVTNASILSPITGVFLVTRLDGPTPAIAKGLVDQALVAERDGLNGEAYFDLRNIQSGAYKRGDEWIGHASEIATATGYQTYVDRQPATLGAGYPLANVAIYAGWYTAAVDGPFAGPKVEFMPGAIAYHLHSYSANAIREPWSHWVGPLLVRGAAVTLGSVDEPYLDGTPNIGLFLERLAMQKFTVGEAGVACQAALSWQNVVIGDPLYRPFNKHPLELEELHTPHPGPLLAWAIQRKVNIYLQKGKPAEVLKRYLMELPLTTNSAILCEKVASMFGDEHRNRLAAEWAGKALSLDASPQQKSRLWQAVADWLRPLDPAGAFDSLEHFATEFPDHPDLLRIRKEQLEFARELGRAESIKRLESEVLRLTPAPTNAPPEKPK